MFGSAGSGTGFKSLMIVMLRHRTNALLSLIVNDQALTDGTRERSGEKEQWLQIVCSRMIFIIIRRCL